MQKVSYTGDGSTTEFTFNFPYYEDTNIIVTKNNQTATGYSIIGTSGGLDADIPYTGGKVVFDTAPTILDTITIARYLPRTRSVDYQPLAKIDPTTLNQDMNYMMEVLKDMQDDLTTFQTQYDSIVNKQETTQLLNKIDNVTEEMEDTNQNIEDFYQAVEDRHIMSTDMFYAHAANSITEIPQNITLTLASGTLTLKKGSNCYLKTDTTSPSVSVASDLTTTQTTDGTYFAIYNGSALTTVATTTYNYTSLPDTYSLPLAIITVSGGAISSIDQVFNGFGYIGSTVFALPGVKVLEPNGRNADGTLHNDSVTVQNVIAKTVPTNLGWHYLTINSAGTNGDLATNFYQAVTKPSNPTTYSRYYNPTENKVYNIVSGVYSSAVQAVIPVRIEHSNTSPYAITAWTSSTTLHAVDYNDREYIANCAMPSNRYIDLTLGASGTTYTAPADGWFYINKASSAAGQNVVMAQSTVYQVSQTQSVSGADTHLMCPVAKGDVITITYTLGGTTNAFRFIYANGAK